MTHRDDSEMSRFERHGQRVYSARDAVGAIALVALLLVLFAGGSIRDATAQIDPGIGRDIVDAVGGPTEWIADRFPLDEAQHELTGGLSPDQELGGGGFGEQLATDTTDDGRSQIPPVTSDAFDPAEIGDTPPPKQELGKLLVTGDSLSTPLDTELARRLVGDGVEVIRDPHLGTAISGTAIADWGQLSTAQVAREQPDAVVVFIGANEGFDLPGPNGTTITCCGVDYAAAFANRIRQVMNTYRQAGAAKVYWLTVMAPRDKQSAEVIKMVNAAIEVAAQPWRDQIRIIDTVPIFTPGFVYRDAIDVDGQETIVRESDGIHLNEEGSSIAADAVIDRIDGDYEFSGG
jgi:lysophospholipase L1-like esterase